MVTASANPRLSVLVLTRNRLAALRNCVHSVLRQQHRDVEILILDDASEHEDTGATLAAELADGRIRHWQAPASLGVAGGRNFLMAQARGEYLIFIDDDAVFVGNQVLDQICQVFEREPAVGIIAFKITNISDGKATALVPLRRSAIARNPQLIEQRTFVPSFIGAGHAIRKSIINELGGYRPDMVFGGEEWDLAYRTIRAGYHIRYEPSIEVNHYPKTSVVGVAKNYGTSEVYYQFRNHVYLAYRYLPWHYAIPYCGAWLFRCALRCFHDESFFDFLRGALAAPRFLRGVKREVLDRNALRYLTKYGGGRGTVY